MKLFVCIFDDARLLPHLLRHYVQFGVTEFHVAAPPHLADYVSLASLGYKVIQYNDFDVADSFTGGVDAVTRMRELSQGPEEWIVIVDLDEFVEFPKPLVDIVRKIEAEGEIWPAASCTIGLPSTVSRRALMTTPICRHYSR